MAGFAMGWRRPDNVAGSSAPAIMVGFFVATGGLLFGYDTGCINGILAMESFRYQFAGNATVNAHTIITTTYPNGTVVQSRPIPPELSVHNQAIIIAMLSLGTIIGALLAAPAGDYMGRKKAIIGSIGVFVFGVIFQVCSTNVPLLLVGRFFAGVGIGAISVLVPLYQSEMAPKWIRGTLVCAYQLCITCGLLGSSIVNLLTNKIDGPAAYRIPMGLQLTWAGILSLGLLVLPETPRYLIKRGLKDAAALSLSRLRRLDITHPALIEELAEINANHEYDMALGTDTYKDLIFGSPHLGRRTMTGCFLQILQQLTGINFIMYYGTSFFQQAGITSAFTVSLIINIVNVVSTIPGLFVVESWGRRRLLLIGSVGMAICQLLIASFTAAAPSNLAQTSMQILVIFLSIYIFFFAATWGPVAWVVTSEIFPLKVRAKSISVTTTANWLLNFGIAYGTPFMVGQGKGSAQLGANVFFIWGAFNIVGAIFVYTMVYETSKLSLEQIDEMYERVPKAWHSSSFEPSWSFQQMRDLGFSDSGIPPEELHDGAEVQHHEIAPTTSHSNTTANTNTSSISTSTSDSDNKMLSTMGNVDFTY